tara:strand:+ start:1216 stop:1569 length:354 start_codon:yes stop_codon:yes gene_type:complete
MSDFYQRMQGVSSKLLKQFAQGTINYIHTPLTGTIYNPTQGTPVNYPLDAVAKGVEFQYIKEGYISASDIQVTSAVFDVEPSQSGRVSIDGKEKQIIAVQQIPAAGVPVAWVIFCKS